MIIRTHIDEFYTTAESFSECKHADRLAQNPWLQPYHDGLAGRDPKSLSVAELDAILPAHFKSSAPMHLCECGECGGKVRKVVILGNVRMGRIHRQCLACAQAAVVALQEEDPAEGTFDARLNEEIGYVPVG